jgi:hypothetical protein
LQEYLKNKPENLQQVVIESFKPVKTVKEAIARFEGIGITDVNLKGFSLEYINSMLDVFENENNLSKLNINAIKTERRAGISWVGFYQPIARALHIHTDRIKRLDHTPVVSWDVQLKELNDKIKSFEKDYLGDPKYNQSDIVRHIKQLKVRESLILKKIADKVPPRPNLVPHLAADNISSFNAVVLHEIGHSRWYDLIENPKYKNKYKDLEFMIQFDVKNAPSEYATTNVKEYFAEWYSYWRMFGDKNVPNDLLTIFKGF